MSTFSGGDSQSNWLSQAEAARLLGITRQAVHKLIRAGRLPIVEFGGRVFVDGERLRGMGQRQRGRPRGDQNAAVDRLKELIDHQPEALQRELLEHLSALHPHPIEAELGVPASLILEALRHSGNMTRRMLRGIIAEGAFHFYTVNGLVGWAALPVPDGRPYDFCLDDGMGEVRVQVKLQRSERGEPIVTPSQHFLVETQRTRGGKKKGTEEKARPYHFHDFDVLAVCMQPSSSRWDDFRYTVANWLLPLQTDPTAMATMQPVSSEADKDWTDDFAECVRRLRAGEARRIGGLTTQRRMK